jgi:hypothetical protein
MHVPPLASGYDARVGALDAAEWHAIVARFDDLNLYQTLPYARSRWPRSAVSHLLLTHGGEVVSAAQVRLLSIPLLGGIAYIRWGPLWRLRGRDRNPEVLRQMARAIASEYVRGRGYMVQVLPGESETSADVSQVLQEEGFRHRASDYTTILIDIRPPMDKLRAGLDSRWRTELNRAQRGSLVLTEGTAPEMFDRFAPIYAEMFERKRLVDLGDLEVFRGVQELLPPDMRMRVMLCSEDGKTDVAGAITSGLGETGLGILWATNPRGRDLRGAYLLQWHVIDWLKSQGCRTYDLGGVSREANPGGHRFKSGLSGKNGREVRFVGTFEMSASPLLPATLHALVDLRTAVRGSREALKSLFSRARPHPRARTD